MKKRAVIALQALAFALVLAIIAGGLLGQPILLSFVETGSMEPEMSPGDGFVSIPASLSGEVSEGDVIVFEAEEIQGGGLTTHRVVDQTDRGYVTRGDANPFTDQDSNEPPVQESQIVATAVQIDGSVVTIPHLGTAVMGIQSVIESTQRWLATTFGTSALLGTQGLALVLFVLSSIVFVLDILRERSSRSPQRTTALERVRNRSNGTRYRTFVVGCALVLVVTASAAMILPGGTTEIGVVSAEFESENPTTIEQGTTDELTYVVENGGIVPTVTYLSTESDGMEATPERVELGPRSTADATIRVDAPEETGYYRYYVAEHRYLAVLPPSTIEWLYERHPYLPLLAINALIGGGVYLVGMLLAPSGRIRKRRRSTTRRQ